MLDITLMVIALLSMAVLYMLTVKNVELVLVAVMAQVAAQSVLQQSVNMILEKLSLMVEKFMLLQLGIKNMIIMIYLI